ncbi:MAG: DUF4202 domain-containing protein [Rhizobiaceae bacterium]
MESARLRAVFDAIDAANAADPALVDVGGRSVPAAEIYGMRMSATLDKFEPGASEALRIAIRGQHIERFLVPRETYPEGKAGYYRWRNELKRRHAVRLAEIMRPLGYDDETIEQVGRIVRKENVKADAESQTLEDVASLVFLAYELDAFLTKYPYPPEKLADILAKTWKKMSPKGHEAALALNPPKAVVDLLRQGLAALDAAG